MNIIDRLKEKYKKQEITILKRVNPYTGTVTYYKYDLDTSIPSVTTSIIESIPKNATVLEYDDFIKNAPFRSKTEQSIYKNDEDFERELKKDPNFFQMSSLYGMKDIEKDKTVKDAYEKCINLRSTLEEKCKELGISFENDKEVIYKKIMRKIERDYYENSKKTGFPLKIDLSYTESDEKLKSAYEYEITHEFDSSRFAYDKRYIVGYYYSFLKDLPKLLNIIKKDKISDIEKETIKNYVELFSIIPEFIKKIDILDNFTYLTEKAKLDKNVSRLSSNNEFIENLNSLLSKANLKNENLFIHATGSIDSAKNIMNKGLYTFSEDLGSFCFPYQDLNQIFNYSYGSETNKVGDYIVLFSLPKTDRSLESISDEEAKKMMGEIDMRRNAVIIAPSHKVIPEKILGIIDKKNMKVLENEKYVIESYDKVSILR